jgi:hypothetical protein
MYNIQGSLHVSHGMKIGFRHLDEYSIRQLIRKRLTIRWWMDWQRDDKGCTLIWFAFHSDVTLMKGHDLFNDSKAHTTPVIITTVGTICLEKALEYTLLVFKGNTNACIGYSNNHIFDILFDTDVYHTAILRKLDAISDDVRPYLI